jgi:phosphoglycolate phosphatase-like HAD superfamily hydrolase
VGVYTGGFCGGEGVKIVLFDIDGTLLSTGGAAREAFARALSEAAGRAISPDGYSFSGRTDPQIARDILAANGVEGEALERAIPEAIRLYIEYFRLLLPARTALMRLMPGVTALLERLAGRTDARTALLTGNVEEGARIKLGRFDLVRYFDFSLSCFGSDDADRYRLPALAVERARRVLGREVQGGHLVLVGDSEHDVLCGREVGARAVAVCTGWTPVETLRAHRPHALLEDLSDTDAALAAILPPGAAPAGRP